MSADADALYGEIITPHSFKLDGETVKAAEQHISRLKEYLETVVNR